jgi:hypothetical protein
MNKRLTEPIKLRIYKLVAEGLTRKIIRQRLGLGKSQLGHFLTKEGLKTMGGK